MEQHDTNRNGDTPSRAANVPPPPTEPHPSVTYNSKREDNLRCTRRMLLHDGRIGGFLVTLAWAVAGLYISLLPSSFSGVVLTFFGILAGGYGLLFLDIHVNLNARFPQKGTVRICTSTILPRGFHDVTPDGTNLLLWANVKDVRYDAGDIYITIGPVSGSFVPKSAFETDEVGRRFYQTARTYWENSRAQAERQDKNDIWNGTQADR